MLEMMLAVVVVAAAVAQSQLFLNTTAGLQCEHLDRNRLEENIFFKE